MTIVSKDQIDRLQKTVDAQSLTITEAGAEIARLREEEEILRSDLDNRRGELAIKEQQIESLEGQLDASKASHAGQTRNTLAFQSLAETRERECDEARALIADVASHLEKKERDGFGVVGVQVIAEHGKDFWVAMADVMDAATPTTPEEGTS